MVGRSAARLRQSLRQLHTRPTVGFSASHSISTERASMDTTLCVHLCLVFNFRGFFERRQCPRRGSQLAVRGKTSAALSCYARFYACTSCTGHDTRQFLNACSNQGWSKLRRD